ncbi:GlxA family transcriptional regulator [Leisingera methylohalidivorans]|uniref:Transcriptional regulator n=1 Tax=Leisingera methylohalidivorans DSM 14336 TaxID=999552 RepID=V9W1Z3_9RHOB|nr:helix-turn-helix domain-containing protein [Leisingera methylohalidivorans]AHD03675.1 transcriptional regulator [Leisingera methylohalidivorans DSM 14336]
MPPRATHVSLIALPEVMISPLAGLYEVLTLFETLGSFDDAMPRDPPFDVQIVTPQDMPETGASGLPHGGGITLDKVDRTDIVIVPSMLVEDAEWVPGRYPELVDWLVARHAEGAILCSACSGVLLLAETGLLDGREATIHWAYEHTFRRNFPKVQLKLQEVLVASGERRDFVMSGASASWHDLVLYLIARLVGPTAAQAIARFMLLQWHVDGQAPYVTFNPPLDHGDAVVRDLQDWLKKNYTIASPVEELERRSGLPGRSFKRRFTKATGTPPIKYVQYLRVEEAKRRLERTDTPIDQIGWNVGYEEPAFFRRLFKRVTRLTPSEYRRKFRMPEFNRSLL